MTLQSINPTNGETFATYHEWPPRQVQDEIGRVHEAYLEWRWTSFDDRAAVMRKAAETLRDNASSYARLMAQEMGKPLRDGIAEAQKCATACDFYAEHAAHFLEREYVSTQARLSFVTFKPLGVVLAVMPWNFPFWQVFRFAAPALMAGNGGVLKHASNVPGCAIAIESVFREAGFPEHLFSTVLVPSAGVEALIRDDRIAAVTLTGSVAAGRSVAAAAGAVLKKCVLELGGADAYVVLEDADISAAAKVCAAARMVNGGQSCIAGKRFVVVRAVRRAFEDALVAAMRGYEMGDPRDPHTKLGP
ncbi:MAG TPA: aldehyde dehydrogenase family protein, partial [Xanthobacteraceae bacterium]